MTKALIDGTVIAESNKTLRIEGNFYFPPDSIKKEFYSDPTELHTVCHWKGEASYRDVKIDENTLKNISWFYPNPDESAISKVGTDFSNYVAFYPQVKIVD